MLQAEFGGQINQHWQRFQLLALNGDEVEVRGQCKSACTLVMIVPKNQLCFGQAAYLAFHQTRRTTSDAPAPEDTKFEGQEMYLYYRGKLCSSDDE